MHAFWCGCSHRSLIIRLVVSLGIVGTFPSATAAGSGDIVLYASDVTRTHGAWQPVGDTSAAGGTMMRSRDNGLAVNAPLANPQDYFEASFYAQANTLYRVWLRLSARSDRPRNDSVWVQFSDALSQAGTPVWRTGSTQALLVALESCDGCAISGWGWRDGAWWIQQNAIVKFPTAGNRTIRVQTREDGVRVDQIVLSPSAFFFSSPGNLVNDATIVQKSTSTAMPVAPEVVLYAADASRRSGNWALQDDPSAAVGKRNGSDNHGWANASSGALSNPQDFLEWTFNAVAGVRYRVWLRLNATDNSTANDSVWVQFSNSVSSTGAPTYRIGTTSGLPVVLENCSGCGVSGWGWQRKAWWLADTGDVHFVTTGLATVRVQTREDGVRIDQVVISPARYATSAPGPGGNDQTLVLRDGTKSSIPSSGSGQTPTTARYVVFVASTDHDRLVNEYVLEIFVAGTSPSSSPPLVSKGLGKPAPVNSQISVDIAATTTMLPAGTYFATMSAVGSGGRTRSAPSPTFTR